MILTIFCIAGIIFIQKKFLRLQKRTFFLIIAFVLLSVFGGKTLGFYYLIPYWDKFLHFLSGIIVSVLGNEILTKASIKEKRCFLIFAFASTAACLWEIFEFSCDKIIGTNAQNNSLSDTMLDMIAGNVSALIYLALKNIFLSLKEEKRR